MRTARTPGEVGGRPPVAPGARALARALPPGSIAPDYDGSSLVNLVQSVAVACGAPPSPDYPPLAALGAESLAGDAPIVLLLIDGLGLDQLRRHGQCPALREHLHAGMTSVFPSTTASAVTTVATGVAVQQHGLTGWFLRVPGCAEPLAPLPFRLRGTWHDAAEAGLAPERVFTSPSLFTGLEVPVDVVHPTDIVDSLYSRHHAAGARRTGAATLRALLDACVDIVRIGGRRLVYAYWPGYDALSHAHGSLAEPACEHLAEIDAEFARLLDRLRGTGARVLVSADHGFVDVDPVEAIAIEAHPRVARCLAGPLTGEPRTAYLHARPGRIDELLGALGEVLGEAGTAVPSSVLVDAGLFGRGAPHRELGLRLGDVTVLMRARNVLYDRVGGEKPGFDLRGVHGGTSQTEMQIPLVFACA